MILKTKTFYLFCNKKTFDILENIKPPFQWAKGDSVNSLITKITCFSQKLAMSFWNERTPLITGTDTERVICFIIIFFTIHIEIIHFSLCLNAVNSVIISMGYTFFISISLLLFIYQSEILKSNFGILTISCLLSMFAEVKIALWIDQKAQNCTFQVWWIIIEKFNINVLLINHGHYFYVWVNNCLFSKLLLFYWVHD